MHNRNLLFAATLLAAALACGGASAQDVACGPTTCQAGEVCCNESCGICVALGDVCTQQVCTPAEPCVDNLLCARGFHWSPVLCQCVADDEGLCTSDDSCRLFDDTCNSCDCRPLSIDDPDPVCADSGVQCFAEPCLGKTARCVDGQCVAECAPLPCGRLEAWDPELCRCVVVRPHRPHPPHSPHSPHTPHQPHSRQVGSPG